MKFIKFKDGTVSVQESESIPTLEDFVQLLNLSDSRDVVHQLHNEFSDPSLLLLCTDLTDTMLVFRKVLSEGGYSLSTLTENQIALVEQKLKTKPNPSQREGFVCTGRSR